MSSRVLTACIFFVAVSQAMAGTARADDCDDITPVDPARRVEAVPTLLAVDIVVPCTALDNGMLGADCADAFYVVNHQGTVLCRVDALAFAVDDDAPSWQRDDRPSVSAHPFATVALPATAPMLPSPPLLVSVTKASVLDDAGPADAHVFERLRPS
jgi:hypothetical protein